MNSDSSSNHAFDPHWSCGDIAEVRVVLTFSTKEIRGLALFWDTVFSWSKVVVRKVFPVFWGPGGAGGQGYGALIQPHYFGLPLCYICFSTDDCLCKIVPQQQQQQQQIGLEISCIWQSLISAHAMKQNFIFPSVHFLLNTIHASSSLC